MTAYDALTWAAILTAGLLWLAILVGVAWVITWPFRAPRRRRRERIRARLRRLVDEDMHPNLRRAADRDLLGTCEEIWATPTTNCRNTERGSQ